MGGKEGVEGMGVPGAGVVGTGCVLVMVAGFVSVLVSILFLGVLES
jgi:hypothetical protein